MRLSEDKISHLSHLIRETAVSERLIETRDSTFLLKRTKQIIVDFCKMDEEVDRVVRSKLHSYSKGLMEGSREWEILYRKHFDEELKKRWP